MRRGGASVPPGATPQTRMPCAAYSMAREAVVDAALRRRVGDPVDAARCHRRHVDDHAGAAFQHSRQYGAAAPERREQRAADLRYDLSLSVFRVGLRPDRAADIVDQDVDMVEVLLRTIDRGDGPGKSFQIGDDGDCFGAGGFGLVPNLLDKRGAIDQRKLATFTR